MHRPVGGEKESYSDREGKEREEEKREWQKGERERERQKGERERGGGLHKADVLPQPEGRSDRRLWQTDVSSNSSQSISPATTSKFYTITTIFVISNFSLENASRTWSTGMRGAKNHALCI